MKKWAVIDVFSDSHLAESIGIEGFGANVVNNGSMTISGDSAIGVAIEGNGAEVTNAGVGEILVSGEESEGIGIEGNGSTILNTNRIVADGFQAVGIGVLGDSGTISNLVGGTIETTGNRSPAIGVIGTGLLGERDIINEGVIKTGGNSSPGIAVRGNSHIIENAATGEISTAGSSSSVIRVVGDFGAIENNGSIITTGNAAIGMEMTANALGKGTLTNNNEITTSAGDGISVTGDSMTITNGGVIETGIAGLGAGHMGISVAGNGVTINNNNTISTFSEDARGISLSSTNLTLLSHITNNGSIITTRDGADGINLSGGNFIVTNMAGGITTQEGGADGIEITGSNVSTNLVLNFAEILVSHETSHAVHLSTLTGERATLTNAASGVLTASNIAVAGGAGNDEVKNDGVINGGVWLKEGNDTYTQGVSGTVNGTVDGGADTDTLVADLSANQTMDGDQFFHFEELKVKEGSGALTITNTLVVGSSEFLSGTVVLGDGSVLSGDATVLGATLMGTGTVGGILRGDNGEIKAGMSTGNLTIDDDLLLFGADLELEVNSLLDMDTLTVGGDVIINGGLMNVILGYTSSSDDVFDFFDVAGSFTVGAGFEGIVGYAAAGSGVPIGTEFKVDLGGQLFEGTVSSVVPIPASVWLFGAGLVGLIGVARRKKV